ncbi:Sec-independent protein translocase subunit TatA [Cellulosimicrobium marinum]|uniref:Sec-independent protein translocase subunit TatA n=1 Tax=Cellulosimicrobium marinum TaxID=1638992 RepID=UPI001E4E97C6|nr:Sec-independent protein translocase subunit TatA [Cellulosimicrobium marinum]MCB7137511.1 Sec-independent protein translocase subunit TatA [Cellulosimicrobium marinum]
MGMLKPWHIIVLVVVILLLFGARRLPDLARSVGQSLKIFKKEVKELTDDDKTENTPEQGPATGTGTSTTPGSTTVPGGTSSTAPDDTSPR